MERKNVPFFGVLHRCNNPKKNTNVAKMNIIFTTFQDIIYALQRHDSSYITVWARNYISVTYAFYYQLIELKLESSSVRYFIPISFSYINKEF